MASQIPQALPVPPAAVVVGVSGGATDATVLAHAAAEATARHRPLHVVHARERLAALSSIAGLPVALEEVDGSREVLSAAAEALADVDLEVTYERTVGTADALLVERSATADLVVVGNATRGAIARAVLGGSTLSVAAHAVCPVLVVPADVDTPTSGRVVVGVDGSHLAVAAVRAGAVEAVARGGTLVLVTTWDLAMVRGYVLTEPDSPEWREHEAGLRSEQVDAVSRALGDHPQVPVEHVVRHDTAVAGLLAAAEGAALLVVGSRGRGGFVGKLLGSVTLGLLKRATLPVLVTRAS